MGTKNAPQGFGIYIAFENTIGTWDESIRRLKSVGARWVAPRAGAGLGRDTRWSPAEAKVAIQKCHDAGIKCYPWLYSYPSSALQQVAIFKALMDEGADGIIIDAEAEFQGKGENGPIAEQFMKALRAAVGEETWIGTAPFPYILWHLDFPYLEFGKYCDNVSTQLYWSEISDAGAQTHIERVSAQWKQYLGQHPGAAGGELTHIGVTYGSELNTPHPPPGKFHASDMLYFMDWCEAQGFSSYSLYSLDAACPEAMEALRKRHEEKSAPVTPVTPAREVETVPVVETPAPVSAPIIVAPAAPVQPPVQQQPSGIMQIIMMVINIVLSMFGIKRQ